ncbi:Uncharacterised protein [[Clostridium] sordellii]|uniref:Uncharacterized protein n=1 Tax=Paraclostridium sordellii TaxID=1505 RepID=A0A0C7R7S3_PARSO|nr:hypothetical protein [Paeniclostridium sordellii]CEQ04104.1 Uncharacterised protein [[Clostridium] sordellii] [Paeniclostridium sordellii]
MRVPLDDDLYEKLDKIGEKFGMTTDSLIELAVEQLIKEIEEINK